MCEGHSSHLFLHLPVAASILRDAYQAEKQEKKYPVYTIQCAREFRERKKKKEMQGRSRFSHNRPEPSTLTYNHNLTFCIGSSSRGCILLSVPEAMIRPEPFSIT